MQDFIKQQNIKSNNITKDSVRNIDVSNTKSTGWLTEDRFWTLFWGLGMAIGLSSSFALAIAQKPHEPFPILSSILLYGTIVLVPLITYRMNKTKCVNGEVFTNKNRLLDKEKIPSSRAWHLLSFVVCIITGLVMDGCARNLDDTIAIPILLSIFFLVPIIPFLIQNCPIAIIFNPALWQYPTHDSSSYNKHYEGNYISDPFYSNMNGNIYNNHK